MASFRRSCAIIGLLSSFSFAAAAVSVLPQDATTGADGVFNLSTDYTLPVDADGIFNFTDFYIDSGASLSVRSDSPVFIYANDFLVNGAIYATVPELYLVGTSISFGSSSTLSNPDGLLALYASDTTTLAGSIDVNTTGSGSNVTIGTDVPDAQTDGSVVLISGNLDILEPVIIPEWSTQITVTSGDVLLEPGDLILTPTPGAAVLFVSGFLGLFARRWMS